MQEIKGFAQLAKRQPQVGPDWGMPRPLRIHSLPFRRRLAVADAARDCQASEVRITLVGHSAPPNCPPHVTE